MPVAIWELRHSIHPHIQYETELEALNRGNFDILILVVPVSIGICCACATSLPRYWGYLRCTADHTKAILVFCPGRCLTIVTLVPQTYWLFCFVNLHSYSYSLAYSERAPRPSRSLPYIYHNTPPWKIKDNTHASKRFSKNKSASDKPLSAEIKINVTHPQLNPPSGINSSNHIPQISTLGIHISISMVSVITVV